MDAKEVFRAKVCAYLVSLPFDLKILQEAVSDPDLERAARELAGGVVIHALSRHQEGSGAEHYIEDALLVRLALEQILVLGGDGAAGFSGRFSEVYETLPEDLRLIRRVLGEELSQWLQRRITLFTRIPWKGKRASQYVDDEEALAELYEGGLDFQTGYSVTEAQVQNKLRRAEQITDLLQRRFAEDAKRR
jgi:hypothetical protein